MRSAPQQAPLMTAEVSTPCVMCRSLSPVAVAVLQSPWTKEPAVFVALQLQPTPQVHNSPHMVSRTVSSVAAGWNSNTA
jgi:hypothetical protein